MLSALEIDIDFNVNVMTGSNGVLRGRPVAIAIPPPVRI